jgi:hypothetical protein
MLLLEFYEPAPAAPRPGETLLASFRLSELRAPQNVLHLQAHPEIAEKLSVFFTLVLRHYLDTDHIPDLRPARTVRDYFLLGLWGDCAPSLSVGLFESAAGGSLRSEIRFLGREQEKAYRADQDRVHEAAQVRRAATLFGPFPEQGILRALSNFLMAVAEQQEGSHSGAIGRVAMTKQTLEVFRETARTGVRGTLVDLATTLEVLLDNAIDVAVKGLDRLERGSKEKN